MKKFTYLLILFLISCNNGTSDKIPPGKWLEYYRTQTQRTDPGKYAFLYSKLPRSVDSLCLLLKKQLIHPFEALQLGIEIENYSQDEDFPNVESMLEALFRSDSLGLHSKRSKENRLVVASYHHAILLASILRYQGIPVRLRDGFSRYYEKDSRVRFGHSICEVWEPKGSRWILVIPELQEVDFNRSRFDFGWEAWKNIQEKKMDPRRYKAPFADGRKAIINSLLLDAAFILQDEKLYWDMPKIVMRDLGKPSDLDQKEITTLNRLSESIANNHSNPENIGDIYYNRDYFRSAKISYATYMEMVRAKN